MQFLTNDRSINSTWSMIKYKVQGYSKNSHGNKKDLLWEALYPTMEKAIDARNSYITLSRCKIFLAPRDTECVKNGESEFVGCRESNFIVTDVVKINYN